MAREVDVVVLGCGPAGERAAIQAARAGRRAVVIERFPVAGGNRVNWGTIPSKTLRESALFFHSLSHMRLHGLRYEIAPEVTVADFMHRERLVKQRELDLLNQSLGRYRLEVVVADDAQEQVAALAAGRLAHEQDRRPLRLRASTWGEPLDVDAVGNHAVQARIVAARVSRHGHDLVGAQVGDELARIEVQVEGDEPGRTVPPAVVHGLEPRRAVQRAHDGRGAPAPDQLVVALRVNQVEAREVLPRHAEGKRQRRQPAAGTRTRTVSYGASSGGGSSLTIVTACPRATSGSYVDTAHPANASYRHKANVLETSRLWRTVVTEVAARSPASICSTSSRTTRAIVERVQAG